MTTACSKKIGGKLLTPDLNRDGRKDCVYLQDDGWLGEKIFGPVLIKEPKGSSYTLLPIYDTIGPYLVTEEDRCVEAYSKNHRKYSTDTELTFFTARVWYEFLSRPILVNTRISNFVFHVDSDTARPLEISARILYSYVAKTCPSMVGNCLSEEVPLERLSYIVDSGRLLREYVRSQVREMVGYLNSKENKTWLNSRLGLMTAVNTINSMTIVDGTEGMCELADPAEELIVRETQLMIDNLPALPIPSFDKSIRAYIYKEVMEKLSISPNRWPHLGEQTFYACLD